MEVFSPGILWIGFRVNLSGSEVQTLHMHSKGVRPLSVLSRGKKLYAETILQTCLRSWSWLP